MTTSAHRTDDEPELQAGDRLTRDEFERRDEAMPHVEKAGPIEGVYMPSPDSDERHGLPHAHAVTWLGHYEAYPAALLRGDMRRVLEPLDRGPASAEHAEFVARLAHPAR